MSLIQRIPDFACQTRSHAPLFNFLDDHSHRATAQRSIKLQPSTKLSLNRSSDFFPGFDVRENSDSYELHGELPGVEKNDIRVEFTSDDALTITGNKERRYIARIDEENEIAMCSTPASEEEDWQQVNDDATAAVIENIDAATIGPVAGYRRTQWQKPTEDIDSWSWSQQHTQERTKRRSSIVNARNYQPPAENIDTWSHTHTQKRAERRPSIVNAKMYQEPIENIDASTAVHHHERARRRPSIVNARVFQQPAENIDAATSGPLRTPLAPSTANANNIPFHSRTSSTVSSSNNSSIKNKLSSFTSQHQPFLLSERPFGPFWREFRFPGPVDRDGVKASLTEGVLTVVVPKRKREVVGRKVIAVE